MSKRFSDVARNQLFGSIAAISSLIQRTKSGLNRCTSTNAKEIEEEIKKSLGDIEARGANMG
jgi:hypothetical protein